MYVREGQRLPTFLGRHYMRKTVPITETVIGIAILLVSAGIVTAFVLIARMPGDPLFQVGQEAETVSQDHHLTVARGMVSETIVKRLAENPWWAEAASPISSTAVHRPETCAAAKIGTTHRAHTSMAVFRPALTLHPRLISHEESQPPPMLPRSVIR